MTLHKEFWRALNDARSALDTGKTSEAGKALDVARGLARVVPAAQAQRREALIAQLQTRIARANRSLEAVRPARRVAGKYDFQPDQTGNRLAEGGSRTRGLFKSGRPNTPLVTIVTAVYDNPDTFERCIASVRAQTWENIEFVVVDGASPESTRRILERHDDFIDYYVSEPDKGIYSAMNKGIALARGDYICLLNSDDFYEPDFVAEAVSAAQDADGPVDVVYTDYAHGGTSLAAQSIGPGVLLGHLNICHNTFLVHRDCYEQVGPYDESFRIVSDAVWIRKAYTHGMCFRHVPRQLFTLAEGGASSGNTEERRQRFISEMAESYRRTFPALTPDEAKALYLLRFNKARVGEVLEIARRHAPADWLFRDALRDYVAYCFGTRENFILRRDEANTLFPDFVALCDLLNVDRRMLRIDTKSGCLSEIFARIDALAARRKATARKTILHFVTVFSAPSETFIYDLLQRLEAETDYDNFVLYEHELLGVERPYEKKFQVHWNDFQPVVAQQLYRQLLDVLRPDIVLAHFAINEHRFQERVAPLGIRIPTVVMTHGIDVFNLKIDSPYTRYVTKELAQRSDVHFTTVSNYLNSELESAGIPRDKITVLPNSVNSRFFANRKATGYFSGDRTLKVLNIGRLVDWKGHGILLEALARYRDECSGRIHLTIVYGGSDEQLPQITAQIDSLNLQDHVTLEPFVDFETRPDYFAGFDIYVHPSRYTDGSLRKSETFGIAVLEAIAAGLPVLSSDAGGLPEVIGEEGPHARIVPHNDAEALFAGLRDMVADPRTFTDNRAFAEARLAEFSPERQIAGLSAIIERLSVRPIRAALFSSSTIQGAGYAAYRLHQGLRQTSVRPTLFTLVDRHRSKPDVRILSHPADDDNRWQALQAPPKPGMTIMTINHTHIPSEHLLRMVEPFDVVNLHWHARFLSAENVATLTHSNKPVVMTIRDMQPITGGCHFFHGCDRWLTDCADCPQIDDAHKDFPAQVLAAKRAHYNFDNLTLVALSTHTRGILERAPMFRDCRIEVIPNSIETDIFRPHDRDKCRAEFGLPADRRIIGYVPSFSSEVKGYRELVQALKILGTTAPDLDPFIMLVGNKTPASRDIAQDKAVLGYIGDNERLARAYSCADVIVVPSLEETFSNTTAEAISCGVPVVGFQTGAIPDLAINGRTGYACTLGDAAELADRIAAVLRGPDMREACRAHAQETLSFMKQAHAYEALFAELVEASRHAPQRPDPAPVWDCFPEVGPGLNRLMAERYGGDLG